MSQGDFDITEIAPKLTDKCPTATQMGKAYARLIQSVDDEDDLPTAIRKVYESPICDTNDNYNTNAYYESSYIQTRAFIDGSFLYKKGLN